MKISKKNYFSVIKKIGDDLPETLRMSNAYMLNHTKQGTDWYLYGKNEEFSKLADLIFQKLEEYIAAKSNKRTPAPKSKVKSSYARYANIDTECRFIQRFLNFHDQVLYKNTFGIFIDELQKAIFEHKITKKSPVAKEILQIQDAAVKQFNSMYNAAHFVLKPTTIKHLKGILEKRENAYDDINEEYATSKRDLMQLDGIGKAALISKLKQLKL
jgi:hypothetical protein